MQKVFTLFVVIIFGTVLLLPLTASSQTVAKQKQISLSFGIVPQQSATKLARLWGPVLTYIIQQTGYILTFKTAKDIPTFEERLLSGQYDISYMNPYHYTVFHANPGYLAFAKEKDKSIQGIVVVKKNSPYKDISELNGLTVAFPAPAAFAATLLPRAYFLKKGLDVTPKYVSSHDSVYRSVAQEIYPAGGGIIRTFDNMNDEVRDQLRILWKTDRFTPHAIAYHQRVGKEWVVAIQKALVQMGEDPKGRVILDDLGMQGFETAVDSDWNDVRALGIDLLQTSSK